MTDCAALIMAGGAGSRMSVSHDLVPKALLELGGRPLLAWTIRRLARAGIHRVHIAVHHRAQETIALLRSRDDLGEVDLDFIVEEEPLGTIGALAHAEEGPHEILVQNGDLLSGIDFDRLLTKHRMEGADLTIATHIEQHRLQLGQVLADGTGRVTEYREKPLKEYRISSGTYIIGPNARRLATRNEFTPFPDFVNSSIAIGLRVVAVPHDRGWVDINDANDLVRARQLLQEDPIAFGIHPSEIKAGDKGGTR